MAQQDNASPVTRGAHHIGLTVPDLQTAQRFFTDTLGYSVVGEKPDYPAVFLSDGGVMITLWQATHPANAIPFDRKNVIGLHHLALAVENDAALDRLHERLQRTDGVKIEFAPEPLNGVPARHMMCNIPGGIRVEFIAVAA
jgi:catechol 2,3-dioxygenase-like lactoylglutathione lyase family enzyme